MNTARPQNRTTPWRRIGIAGAVMLVAGCGAPAEIPSPNIVFIMADDLGYNHLGSYGQTRIRTPNLDQLAADGMRFTQFYSGSTVCAPARSVLMTGLHSGHTAVRGNYGGIPIEDEDVTVGEVLQAAGYRTGVFGKWGLGDHGTDGVPYRQGFDEFFGYLNQVHAHFYYTPFLWDNDRRFPLDGNDGTERVTYTHDVITDRALDFIRRNRDERFFLYLAFTIPHTELLVPDDAYAEYDGAFPEPNPYPGDGHYAAQPKPRTAFAAMVSRMDRDVGRVMDLLRELGIDDETFVFFTSDNGGQEGWGVDLNFFEGNAPFRGSKMNLYEGGIRVPAIARWPGVVPAGVTSDHVWAFWDMLPTLSELAGGTTPAGLDGISAVPTLLGPRSGREQDTHEALYWEYGGTTGNTNLRQAVRMGRWKAVRNAPDAPLELYDLMADTTESVDVASEHPDVVATIEAYLATARTEPRPVPEAFRNFQYAGQDQPSR